MLFPMCSASRHQPILGLLVLDLVLILIQNDGGSKNLPTASQQGYSTSTRNKKVDGTLTSYEDSGLAAKCWKIYATLTSYTLSGLHAVVLHSVSLPWNLWIVASWAKLSGSLAALAFASSSLRASSHKTCMNHKSQSRSSCLKSGGVMSHDWTLFLTNKYATGYRPLHGIAETTLKALCSSWLDWTMTSAWPKKCSQLPAPTQVPSSKSLIQHDKSDKVRQVLCPQLFLAQEMHLATPLPASTSGCSHTAEKVLPKMLTLRMADQLRNMVDYNSPSGSRVA